MDDDLSLLGPEVEGFAPSMAPNGFSFMRVVDPSTHWDPGCAHGGQRYPHLRAADGGVVVVVPLAAVGPLSRSGYVLIS